MPAPYVRIDIDEIDMLTACGIWVIMTKDFRSPLSTISKSSLYETVEATSGFKSSYEHTWALGLNLLTRNNVPSR